MFLEDLLHRVIERKASDLHLKVGRPPVYRIDGKLQTFDENPLTKSDVEDFIKKLVGEKGLTKLEEKKGIDCAYSISGLSRFRANIFIQRGTPAIALRTIPFEVPTLEKLKLPAVVKNLTHSQNGLILITGPAGTGKSTTLAAMIEEINQTEDKNIITIEEPIEFLFKDKLSSIMQREVGSDVESFSEGLKMIFRQDPDVIVIGEMRDHEAMQTSITAAETGHLVMGTLHTSDATQTIDRIIDLFPANQQKQVRIQLSQSLKGILSQRLVSRKNGNGRIAAVEILLWSPIIAELILEGRSAEIYDVIRTSVENYYMQTFEQSFAALVVFDEITYEEARANSQRVSELDASLRALFPDYST